MKQFVKTVLFASCVSAALSAHVSAQTAADGGGKQVCESIVWDGGDPSDEASRIRGGGLSARITSCCCGTVASAMTRARRPRSPDAT